MINTGSPTQPFDILEALNQDSQRYAVLCLGEKEKKENKEENSQEEQQKENTVLEWLGFFSSGAYWLLNLTEARMVVPYSAVSSVPGVYPWMKGIMHLQGHIIPVTDLEAYWTKRSLNITKASRIIVVKNNEEWYGFLVERLCGVIKLKEGFLEKVIYEGETWSLFSAETLINEAHFHEIFSG